MNNENEGTNVKNKNMLNKICIISSCLLEYREKVKEAFSIPGGKAVGSEHFLSFFFGIGKTVDSSVSLC